MRRIERSIVSPCRQRPSLANAIHSRCHRGLLKRLTAIVAVAVALVAVGTTAHAQVDLRIDFSNGTSTTAGNWNNISALQGLTANLIDFPTGAATGVSIDGTGSPWRNFVGAASFPTTSWMQSSAAQDGAGLFQGEIGSYHLFGLGGSSYTIELVSARDDFGYLNTFTVNGVAANRTFQGTPVNSPWNSSTDGLANANWLIWDNVAPVAGGITVTDAANSRTLAVLSAMRVSGAAVVAPEPASLVLLATGLGGIATVTFARRRRA